MFVTPAHGAGRNRGFRSRTDRQSRQTDALHRTARDRFGLLQEKSRGPLMFRSSGTQEHAFTKVSGALERRTHEPFKERMAIKRTRFELWVELYPDKPRMIAEFDDLNQLSIRGQSTEDHALSGKQLTVRIVKLVAMTMTF